MAGSVRTTAMNRDRPRPADVEARLEGLGPVLARVPGVVFAYLFGSAASGGLGPLSDVDVAIFVDEGSDRDATRFRALDAVTRHLGTDAVDLVVLNDAPTALLARILPARRVIADSQPFVRHRFESLEMRKAADFRIFERRILERRFGRGG
jgi:predicted nucleotidyltransferase